MQVEKLDKMIKGWFVGNFEPSLHKTNDVEVAVKKYEPNEAEEAHYHKLATEITVIVSGEVEINGKRYSEGDMIVAKPYEVMSFKPLTKVTTTVVKIPGANDDKYLEGEE